MGQPTKIKDIQWEQDIFLSSLLHPQNLEELMALRRHSMNICWLNELMIKWQSWESFIVSAHVVVHFLNWSIGSIGLGKCCALYLVWSPVLSAVSRTLGTEWTIKCVCDTYWVLDKYRQKQKYEKLVALTTSKYICSGVYASYAVKKRGR